MIFTTPRARPVAWPKSAGTRVLIYDRSDLMRAALAQFVGGQPDLLICGTAATAEGALRHALRLEPDVVVLGLSFERPGALLHLIGDIRSVHPRGRVLVLSLTDQDPSPLGVRKAGGLGCGGKYEPPDRVLAGIRSVAAGCPFGVPVG